MLILDNAELAREKYSDLLEKLTGKQIDEMFGDPVTKDTHKKS